MMPSNATPKPPTMPIDVASLFILDELVLQSMIAARSQVFRKSGSP
jgi:hypothetical protein